MENAILLFERFWKRDYYDFAEKNALSPILADALEEAGFSPEEGVRGFLEILRTGSTTKTTRARPTTSMRSGGGLRLLRAGKSSWCNGRYHARLTLLVVSAPRRRRLLRVFSFINYGATLMATSASYTKLKSGDWGIRIVGKAKEGDTVVVTKKDGSTATEKIVKIVWQKDGVILAAISKRAPQASRSSGGFGRGQRTGCSCGSIEGEVQDTDCRTCRFDEIDM